MIKNLAATLVDPEYLKRIKNSTGIKPSHADLFFKWVVGGMTRTDDKKFFEAFKAIRKQVPHWYFSEPKYPLYRDIEISPQAIHDLQERTVPIKLKPRVLTSWKESYAVVNELIEQDSSSDKVGIVVEARPKRIVCIVTEKLIKYLDPDNKFGGLTRDLNEVIVYGNGVDFLIPRTIKSLNYKGKSVTLQNFQGIFKIKESDFTVSYDKTLEKYLFGLKVHKLNKQPYDGKSFEYLIKNITGTTMTEAIDKLKQHGFVAGKMTEAKRGKKVGLVNRRENLGIALEENIQYKIIRITLYPINARDAK